MRATYMYGAGDVRVIDVPDPVDPAAHRRDRPRRALLHLRLRPAPVPLHARHAGGRVDGPRVPRRRRGDRHRGRDGQARRPGHRAVRLVRRHLRLLPRGPADLVPPRRLLERRRRRRRPGRGRPRATRRRHPRRGARSARTRRCSPSLLTLSDVFGTGYHAAVEARRQPAHDRHRHRRRRRRPDGRAVRQAARRRADHPHGPAHAPAPTSAASSAPPTSSPNAATRASQKVRDLTGGDGTHVVLEAVGHMPAYEQAVGVVRAGGVDQPRRRTAVRGRPGRLRQPLRPQHHPHRRTRTRPRLHRDPACPTSSTAASNPGRVFDREITLDEVPEGYKAMDGRQALKVLIRP